MAVKTLAAPAARSAEGDPLARFLKTTQAAEAALDQARQALDDSDFLIDAIRTVVAAFPGSDQEKRASGGDLGQLARTLAWLEEERCRLGGRTQLRAHLTVPELAAALGWSRNKVYRWLDLDRIPGVTQPGGPGTEYLIPADTVERMQDSNGKEE